MKNFILIVAGIIFINLSSASRNYININNTLGSNSIIASEYYSSSNTSVFAINWTEPVDETFDACEFDGVDLTTRQINLDAAIAQWVQDNQDLISPSGGCSNINLSNDFTTQSIDYCTGGSLTITWTITDGCETITTMAIFTVNGPAPITISLPTDQNVNACIYYNLDPIQAQNNLDAAISDWVDSNQNVMFPIGGCFPILTNNYNNQSINFCTGGSIEVTWLVDDICESIYVSASFTVFPPPPVTSETVNSISRDACDFYNSYPGQYQNYLDMDILAWFNSNLDTIEAQGGCNPIISNDFNNQSIDFCIGGSIAVTWTIEDHCESISHTSTYTLNPLPPLQFTEPVDLTVEACDFANQNEVNIAFMSWYSNILAQANLQGGCSPITMEEFDEVIPKHCSGGTSIINYTVSDICESLNFDAQFTLIPLTSACDIVDRDCDGILNDIDNCPDMANFFQTDLNNNGIGDACEDFPKFGVNTHDPKTELHLSNGTLYIDNPEKGIIMKDYEGNCFMLKINDGNLVTIAVPCPN